MPTLTRRTYKPKREHKELGYKKSKEWQVFYGSRAWHTLRNWYMLEHPLCENCLQYGITTPATDCHHKHPFRLGKTKQDKWDLFLDPSNLMALCESCHHRIHNKINETQQIVYDVIPEKYEAMNQTK